MPNQWRGRLPQAAANVLAVIFGISTTEAQTVDNAVTCRGILTGTFLTTIRASTGAFASRSAVTLHGDGTQSAIDSRQHQGVQGTSFSAQQGAYRCTGSRTASATTLNFGFPRQETIARSDWSITYNTETKSIAGTITVFIYIGVEGVDPFGKDGKQIDMFRFTSVRVAPPSR